MVLSGTLPLWSLFKHLEFQKLKKYVFRRRVVLISYATSRIFTETFSSSLSKQVCFLEFPYFSLDLQFATFTLGPF